MRRLWFFTFLTLSLSANASPPNIRVALQKNVSSVTIEGKDLFVQTLEYKPISYSVPSPLRVHPAPDGLRVNGDLFPNDQLFIHNTDEKLKMGGKTFQGNLLIIRKGDKLWMINELPLETYLIGLVHGEISASWPSEAIKAQVVAARTYALHRQQARQKSEKTFYDLESDTADQVYVGSQGESDQSIIEAIQTTQGEVLWYLGLYPAYFHSCCGGQTELASTVWDSHEHSTSVRDPYCIDTPQKSWQLAMSISDFMNALRSRGLEGKHLKKIIVEKQEEGPRNSLIIIESDTNTLFLGATDLRRILGPEKFKSTWFTVEQGPKGLIFTGTGYGHGVGMCQWGSRRLAEKGASYKTILQFYYPKALIKKIY